MGLSKQLMNHLKNHTPPKWKRRPEVLLSPQIPKPMHGVCPRELLGNKWWDATRRQASLLTDWHCVACGVSKYEAKGHQWLEGHEVYDIDYLLGRMYYVETVPICHYCHSYIHLGRLAAMLERRCVTMDRYVAVVKHGDAVLHEARLVREEYIGPCADWSEWRLVLFGQEYPPKYDSFREWQDMYGV